MNIELIQPNDDSPSVYREWIERRGYGFHHWGRATSNFDRDVAKYQAAGHDLVFLAGVPSGGHVAYMDTTADLPGYVELIELGAGFRGAVQQVLSRQHRLGWRGSGAIVYLTRTSSSIGTSAANTASSAASRSAQRSTRMPLTPWAAASAQKSRCGSCTPGSVLMSKRLPNSSSAR